MSGHLRGVHGAQRIAAGLSARPQEIRPLGVDQRLAQYRVTFGHQGFGAVGDPAQGVALGLQRRPVGLRGNVGAARELFGDKSGRRVVHVRWRMCERGLERGAIEPDHVGRTFVSVEIEAVAVGMQSYVDLLTCVQMTDWTGALTAGPRLRGASKNRNKND